MPQFAWEARDRAGRSITGTIEAATKEDVMSRLQAQGLTIVSVDSTSRGSGTVDFVARLESRHTQTVDYAARLQPSSSPRQPLVMPVAAAAVFGSLGVAVWRYIPGATIVALVFFGIAGAILALLLIRLVMPARVEAAARALAERAERQRKQR